MPENNYIKEGWGLAKMIDNESKKETLIASDGTSKLKFVDVDSWKTTKRTLVKPKDVDMPGMESNYINELEVIKEDPTN